MLKKKKDLAALKGNVFSQERGKDGEFFMLPL